MTDREFRLRQRIDHYQDTVEKLENQLKELRKRNARNNQRVYDARSGREVWRMRYLDARANERRSARELKSVRANVKAWQARYFDLVNGGKR